MHRVRKSFGCLAMALIALAVPVLAATEASAAARRCSPKKIAEILAPVSKKKPSVDIDCSVTLKPGDVVTKQVRFLGPAASGVTFDCRGAKIASRVQRRMGDGIQILSRRKGNDPKTARWTRPEGIVIRDCRIETSIRVMGMGRNGEDRYVRQSSLEPGHTKRAQQAAPTNITLSKVTIHSTKGRTPIYLAPGVTRFTLEHSVVSGKSNALAVYLDAESAHNVFRNNTFRVRTKYRELFAVDGSADNLIIGNRFAALQHGGIYLYRNCGEGGTVRHQAPQRNHIINNVFVYKDFSGFTLPTRNWLSGSFDLTGKVPAIWAGSRGGLQPWCHMDSAHKLGSGVDNGDNARGNVIAHNQILKLDPATMIEIDDKPNLVFGNETVKTPVKRKSGCYVAGGLPKPFIRDGESIDRFDKNGKPVCTGEKRTCDDGRAIARRITCR